MARPVHFGFAELIAIPRPFTEALVFAALAALAANRDGVSILFIAAAALLHPIMAIAGMGVFVTVRCLEDIRWVWYCAIGGALLIVAGTLDLPLVDRLFITIEPSLRSLHEMRSPFLFPSLWPIESFPPLIVQATTLAIAAHFQHGRRRTILAAIMVVGLGSIIISTIFGDWQSSLLFVQAQLWRMAWLAAAAAMALGRRLRRIVAGRAKRAVGLGVSGAWLVDCGLFRRRQAAHKPVCARRAALLLVVVVGRWDHRSPAQRMMEENQRPPELMQLIDQRQGEILWMDGLAEPWFVLGQPQWATPLQGSRLFFRPCLPPNGGVECKS
jgi:hypothetical protein